MALNERRGASHLSSEHGQWRSQEWAEGFQQDWGERSGRQFRNFRMTDDDF